MEDELAKLKKTKDQAQKNEILAKNIQNNRTSSISSATKYNTESGSSEISKVNPMQFNLKNINIKNKIMKKSENPYRNKSRDHDLNQSISDVVDLNKSVVEAPSAGLNISNIGGVSGQFSLQKNYQSVNSARDIENKNESLINKLKE